MIRIVIADDHTMIREGLKRVLTEAADFLLVGEAENGNSVMARVRDLDFDVLVLDLSMPGPGRSGIQLIKQVHAEKPRLRILIQSMHQEPQYAVHSIKSGASGYLTKDCASTELVAAIRRVAAGGAYITSDVAEQLALNAMPGSAGPSHRLLSSRELEIFMLLAKGAAVSQIAAQLGLSVKTVSTHKANLMAKMGLNNASDLIRYALQNKLVDDLPHSA